MRFRTRTVVVISIRNCHLVLFLSKYLTKPDQIENHTGLRTQEIINQQYQEFFWINQQYDIKIWTLNASTDENQSQSLSKWTDEDENKKKIKTWASTKQNIHFTTSIPKMQRGKISLLEEREIDHWKISKIISIWLWMWINKSKFINLHKKNKK